MEIMHTTGTDFMTKILVTILFVIRGMESSPNFLQFDKDGTKGLL
jgi:hypothetical protein